MSTYLAIATVTRALVNLLQPAAHEVVPGVEVTAVRPETAAQDPTKARINVVLYGVTPDPAWRNADLPTRDSGGRAVQRPQLALALDYLLSFHGNDTMLEAERLLGRVTAALHARPVLTRETLHSALQHVVRDAPNGTADAAMLAQQADSVRLTLQTLRLEDLSKLWSSYQVPFALSVAYRASLVLIEAADVPVEPAPPVRVRQFAVQPTQQPVLNALDPPHSKPGTRLALHGQNLAATGAAIHIGDRTLAPDDVLPEQISVHLPADLPAGISPVTVQYPFDPAHPEQGNLTSNALPLVIQPLVGDVNMGRKWLKIEVTPPVGAAQRVTLRLIPADADTAAHLIALEPGAQTGDTLQFDLTGIAKGTYRVHLRVDGADNWLEPDQQPPVIDR